MTQKTLLSIAQDMQVDLKTELTRLYWSEQCSLKDIGVIFNVSAMTIHKNMKRLDIPRRTHDEGTRLVDREGSKNPMYNKQRSSESIIKQSDSLKETIRLRGEHWSKGYKYTQEQLAKRPDVTGDKNANWKGGIRNHEGYIEIYMPNHPNCNKHNKTVYEHRLVMENHLGRYLTSKEVIHHINEDKSDNRIENLEVMSKNDHILLHASLTRQRTPKDSSHFWDGRGKWSAIYDSCRRCNSNEVIHASNGICKRCYTYISRRKEWVLWVEKS